MAKKQTASERVDELEQLLIDAWHAAQESDGSRGDQQAALDRIQSLIEDAMPDVATFEPTPDDEDSEDSESDE